MLFLEHYLDYLMETRSTSGRSTPRGTGKKTVEQAPETSGAARSKVSLKDDLRKGKAEARKQMLQGGKEAFEKGNRFQTASAGGIGAIGGAGAGNIIGYLLGRKKGKGKKYATIGSAIGAGLGAATGVGTMAGLKAKNASATQRSINARIKQQIKAKK